MFRVLTPKFEWEESRMKKQLIAVFVILTMVFSSIGYAQVTDVLSVTGSASASPPEYDVYISPRSALKRAAGCG